MGAVDDGALGFDQRFQILAALGGNEPFGIELEHDLEGGFETGDAGPAAVEDGGEAFGVPDGGVDEIDAMTLGDPFHFLGGGEGVEPEIGGHGDAGWGKGAGRGGRDAMDQDAVFVADGAWGAVGGAGDDVDALAVLDEAAGDFGGHAADAAD